MQWQRQQRRRLSERSFCAIWVAVSWLVASGCVHTGAGGSVSRSVCLTRAEVARLLKYKARCKADRARHVAALRHARQVERTRAEGRIAEVRIERDACQRRVEALARRRCGRCLLPWVLVGASVAAGVVGVVLVGVLR